MQITKGTKVVGQRVLAAVYELNHSLKKARFYSCDAQFDGEVHYWEACTDETKAAIDYLQISARASNWLDLMAQTNSIYNL